MTRILLRFCFAGYLSGVKSDDWGKKNQACVLLTGRGGGLPFGPFCRRHTKRPGIVFCVGVETGGTVQVQVVVGKCGWVSRVLAIAQIFKSTAHRPRSVARSVINSSADVVF